MSIRVEKVNYIYGKGTPYERKALDGVNLEIHKGEFVGIIAVSYTHLDVYKRQAIGLGTIAAITAVAVNGIGDYTLFSIAVSMCFWALMAIGMSSYEDRLETDNR